MKLNYFLLSLVIIFLGIAIFQSCSRDKQTEKFYDNQQAQLDSLKSEVRRQSARRVDSIKVIEKHLTILEKDKTDQTNEVYSANNVNDVIVLYIRNRPDSIRTD